MAVSPDDMIAAIDAALMGTLTANQQAYSINGRSLTRLSPRELIEVRKHYVQLALSASGGYRPAKVRFGNPTP